MSPPRHIPVLLHEVLSTLSPRPGDIYLDCTAGLGGHASAVAPHLGPAGTIILNDLDPGNLTIAEPIVAASLKTRAQASEVSATRILTHRSNFASLPNWLLTQKLTPNLLLTDLGFASPQVDDPARGLSFMREGPLDMRMDPSAGSTAADLVNSLSEDDLTQIIRDYGEERHARLVAQRIIRARAAAKLITTTQLADVVRSALSGKSAGPGSGKQIDPATRTFQALRIAVNDELGNLEALLAHIIRAAHAIAQGKPTWLAPGARIAFIAFHSLEDRPVKQAFSTLAAANLAADLTPKPLTATDAELADNPRSRSAKLRAIRLGIGK